MRSRAIRLFMLRPQPVSVSNGAPRYQRGFGSCSSFPDRLPMMICYGAARSRYGFLEALPASLDCTVEVRHRDFFAKGEAEKALNGGLRERQLARVCFDSRALFAAPAEDPATRDAQRKKPRLPVHVLPGEVAPVIRYVGHPDLQANRLFLAPWVERVVCWIEAGKQPHMFIHMPDNGDALALAALWHEMLTERLPWLAPLPLGRQVSQPGLF